MAIMLQPDELKSNEPLTWTPGRGTDVWAMICASIAGDLSAIERRVQNDPSLVHCQYAYRTPLYFAVRENKIDVADFVLRRGTDPFGLAVNDSLLEFCHDRGHAVMEMLLGTTYATLH